MSADAAISADLLALLGELEPEAAVSEIYRLELQAPAVVARLAASALHQAEQEPHLAARWLAVAGRLNDATGADLGLKGQIAYAQARLQVHAGDLEDAAATLYQAQSWWQELGDHAWLARSYLGLTQILAMQGRYPEAEAAIRAAIANLGGQATTDAGELPKLAAAYRNLATLLVYQEQHAAALAAYDEAERHLRRSIQIADDAADLSPELRSELAHIALNRASTLTFLDQTAAAEAALQQAIRLFDQIGEITDRGRANTNLGRLYLRTGQYAAALKAFDLSARDLIGDVSLDATPDWEHLRQADELLLEHAMAYLALNLLPETAATLQRCVALFTRSQQPYELAQTLYTLGLLHTHMGDMAPARTALQAAEDDFNRLQNRFWANPRALPWRHGSTASAKKRTPKIA